ncbi:MAG: response regulator [Halobacteriaceae archaeon]
MSTNGGEVRSGPISAVADGGVGEQLGGLTVLIADDDEGLRETVRYWLSEYDIDLLEASEGHETIERIDDTVDVLLLDRRMPGLSGPEVVDRLDDTSFDGQVLVVSAYEPDRFLNEDDVEGYLTKPIDRDQILNELADANR